MIFKPKLAGAAIALALLAPLPVKAATVGITSLTGNDTIDWSQIGPDGTNVPVAIVTTGLGSTVVGSSVGGQLVRLTQGSTWGGNFPSGMAVLYTNAVGPDITLEFFTPVFAVGAEIQANIFGGFTAQVVGGGETFTEDGVSNNVEGGAIFIGLSSDDPISEIEFTLTAAIDGSVNDFAIGTVELSTSPLVASPLPSTWTMLIAGFVGLGFFGYRGTKKGDAAIAAA